MYNEPSLDSFGVGLFKVSRIVRRANLESSGGEWEHFIPLCLSQGHSTNEPRAVIMKL